jgi:Uma2 family endonuclease
MSYAEFLAWADEDTHAEWVNGEVILLGPYSSRHQALLGFLCILIESFIRLYDLGRVQLGPFELKLDPEAAAREPDLMFLAKHHLARLTDERVAGPPDLIIEIVSNDSVHRDRVDKFDEYEAGGVPEYWILDNRPNRNQAYFYQLTPDGHYQRIMPDADGIYRSRAIPGFWLRLAWVWQDHPHTLRALGELIEPSQLAQALQHTLDQPPPVSPSDNPTP